MTYATVMVHAESAIEAEPRLRFAASVANLFGARLIGVGAEIFAPTYDLVSAAALALETAGLEASVEQAHARFGAIAEGVPEGAEWRGFVGYPNEVLARECRAADLVVAGRPGSHLASYHVATDPGELLMRCGRPVLIAPPHETRIEPSRVLVGWKDTREARRAVVDALPFLLRARQVVVLGVREGDGAESPEGVYDVAAMLGRHGVKAVAQMRTSPHAAQAQDLFDAAEDIGAGLVVAGAYGHSRLREWLFGGVTKGFLAGGAIPVLLSR